MTSWDLTKIDLPTLQEHADIALAVIDAFQEAQDIPRIPVTLFPQPISSKDAPGQVIFGYANREKIAISLTTRTDYFGVAGVELDPEVIRAISEMDLILATFEECFHFWQYTNYPESMMVYKSFVINEYRSDPIEHEAKSFAFAMTEKYLDKTFKGSLLEYFRNVLFAIRRSEFFE